MKYQCGLLLFSLFLGWTLNGFAGDFYLDSRYNKSTLRMEIDNDAIWQVDSNFSNGWSLQYQTLRYDKWEDTRAPKPIQWVGTHFPTLGDTDSIVRNGHAIGQNMITPGDIKAPEPQEDDLPYAGTFTYTLSWQSFNRESARTFQISIGILGEEALAKEFQKFVHNNLGFGADPMGWDTQRDSEPIVNIGYRYNFSLARTGAFTNGWAGQLSMAPSASVGNLSTSLDLNLGLRFGWNILEGFSVIPSPPGRGFSQASYLPKPSSASAHSFEVILGARFSYLIYSVLYDGSLITGDDRKVEREDLYICGIVGLNFHYYNICSIGFHIVASSDVLKRKSLPEPPPGRNETSADVSYGALIIDFHL